MSGFAVSRSTSSVTASRPHAVSVWGHDAFNHQVEGAFYTKVEVASNISSENYTPQPKEYLQRTYWEEDRSEERLLDLTFMGANNSDRAARRTISQINMTRISMREIARRTEKLLQEMHYRSHSEYLAQFLICPTPDNHTEDSWLISKKIAEPVLLIETWENQHRAESSVAVLERTGSHSPAWTAVVQDTSLTLIKGRLLSRLRRFAAFKEGWDGYSAQPLSKAAVRNARAFLDAFGQAVENSHFSASDVFPQVEAGIDGSVTFFWERDGAFASVEVGDDNVLHWFVEAGSVVMEEDEQFDGWLMPPSLWTSLSLHTL
ncbi:hypothetical protein [Paracraurococcus lichenis]|uniref:Uncharacterized protein n=1 Tax=Paracraurococcus lichenis TaxID=3064888 RepID=A0ABT9E574_9PROT|nr:hypothetical protein [Paracraurococcus sp. LOR1-02]MDO9711324.1 hypothetical protein [Paracraurococcus sp. LOR1-02]